MPKVHLAPSNLFDAQTHFHTLIIKTLIFMATTLLRCVGGLAVGGLAVGGLTGYGRGSKSNYKAPEKMPVRALPAEWYTSPELYELEKRSIFSRRWQLITHKNRIPNSGDWLNFEVADFNFILARNRKGEINAFHNICRHRAYPIVHKEQGTSSIFSCK